MEIDGRNLILGLIIALIAFVGGVVVAHPSTPAQPSKTEYRAPVPKPVEKRVGDPELLLSGHIRSIDWQGRSFLYETDWGYIRTIGPVCGHEQMPIWQGMYLYELNFHWRELSENTSGTGCFLLDFIGHSPSGDLHEPVTAAGATTKRE